LELSHGFIVPNHQAIADKSQDTAQCVAPSLDSVQPMASISDLPLESQPEIIPEFKITEENFNFYDTSSLKTESISISPSGIQDLYNDTILSPQISVWRSNTTYLLCGNVAQIQPGPNHYFEDYPDERQQSMMITIFIPPDESNPDKTFLSVTCQVLETSFIPAEKISRSSLYTVQSSSLAYL